MATDKTVKPSLIIVSGWTGSGKSTMADHIGTSLGATVASFDWLMSGLRIHAAVWPTVEEPRERQRQVGRDLLSRVAEQQLRRRASCVLDLVASETIVVDWRALAVRYDARFGVVECVCSDTDIHKSRIEGRDRGIPGWYELDWSSVEGGRTRYESLSEPKLRLDACVALSDNKRSCDEWLEAL